LSYKTWVFDCDGVLIDSNLIKTEAFRHVALPYGQEAAQKLTDYHRRHGGLSRYKKLEYLLGTILGMTDYAGELEQGLAEFSKYTLARLGDCPEAPGLRKFLDSLPPGSRRYVVSGGKTEEVRAVLEHKGLAAYFDAIFGSPGSKDAALTQIEATGGLPRPALYFGDARLDYEVANRFGLDFVFMYGMTQLPDWQEFFADKKAVRIAADFDHIQLE